MCCEIQREVKGRDQTDWSDGESFRDRRVSSSTRFIRKICILSVDSCRFLGSQLERLDKTIGFSTSILDWFTCLDREVVAEFIATTSGFVDHILENLLQRQGYKNILEYRTVEQNMVYPVP